MAVLRIATRRSPLALWQAEHVAGALRERNPELAVELVAMRTSGDRMLDAPLAKVGGKGLFIKELEHALFDGRADIAVHSMKDVPVELPPGLHLPVIMARADPRDALVSTRFGGLGALPEGASVGTSSLRRRCQLAAHRPDLRIENLRGGVDTRLRRLDDGDFDAIVLAVSGLERGWGTVRGWRRRSMSQRCCRRRGAGGARCRMPSRRHPGGGADCPARMSAHHVVRAFGAGVQPAARRRMPGTDRGVMRPSTARR